MPYLRELLSGLNFLECKGSLGVEVKGVAFDSRRVAPGFLFVCIPGFQQDGHDFIPEALVRGAVALVGEKPVVVPPGISWIRVESSRRALALISANFYGWPAQKVRLIGVTGTNGKTTIVHLVALLLSRKGAKVGLSSTVNTCLNGETFPSERTTPESLDLQALLARMVAGGANYVVTEVSSHALALSRVAGCEYDVAVFTNLTPDHLDFHPDLEAYFQAKACLFRELALGIKEKVRKYAVINVDSTWGKRLVSETPVSVITFGFGQEAQVQGRNIEVGPKGTSLKVVFPGGEVDLHAKLVGRFNAANLLAAFAVGWKEGLPLSLLKEGLEAFSGVPGRFERVEAGQDFTVIVDYAHTPDGLENVLRTARELTPRRIITVFGCGGNRDRSKRPLMGEIAARESDFCVVTTDNPRFEDPAAIISEIKPGLEKVKPQCYEVVLDRAQAIATALNLACPGDLVLIAGKGHETYQIFRDCTFPFDDRVVARKFLEQKYGAGNR